MQWTAMNQLQLNPSKSCFLTYKVSDEDNVRLSINDKDIIEKSEYMKFLGVNISYDMKWELHINHVANKIIPYCYGLLRTSSTLNIAALKSIYYAYIHSNLKYGIICWGNSTNSKKLFTLQKRALRYIAKAKQQDSCKPLFKSLNILTLTSIYILECALFVKKNNDKFIKNKTFRQYVTRNNDGLEIITHRTSLFETSPYYSCVKIFNRISNNIKHLPLTKFKRKFRSYLIEKCFYKLDDFFQCDQ